MQRLSYTGEAAAIPIPHNPLPVIIASPRPSSHFQAQSFFLPAPVAPVLPQSLMDPTVSFSTSVQTSLAVSCYDQSRQSLEGTKQCTSCEEEQRQGKASFGTRMMKERESPTCGRTHSLCVSSPLFRSCIL